MYYLSWFICLMFLLVTHFLPLFLLKSHAFLKTKKQSFSFCASSIHFSQRWHSKYLPTWWVTTIQEIVLLIVPSYSYQHNYPFPSRKVSIHSPSEPRNPGSLPLEWPNALFPCSVGLQTSGTCYRPELQKQWLLHLKEVAANGSILFFRAKNYFTNLPS